jgi:hypothetical protein
MNMREIVIEMHLEIRGTAIDAGAPQFQLIEVNFVVAENICRGVKGAT